MTDLVTSRRRAPVPIADALMVHGRSAAAGACVHGGGTDGRRRHVALAPEDFAAPGHLTWLEDPAGARGKAWRAPTPAEGLAAGERP